MYHLFTEGSEMRQKKKKNMLCHATFNNNIVKKHLDNTTQCSWYPSVIQSNLLVGRLCSVICETKNVLTFCVTSGVICSKGCSLANIKTICKTLDQTNLELLQRTRTLTRFPIIKIRIQRTNWFHHLNIL